VFAKSSSFNEFLHELELGFIHKLSVEYKCEKTKIYHLEPVISMKNMLTAFQWSRMAGSLSSLNRLKPCNEHTQSTQYESYDTYLKNYSRRANFVAIDNDNWKLSKCTCNYWSKYYKCKHALALCEQAGKFQFSLQLAKNPKQSSFYVFLFVDAHLRF
jgi:hypothetical protein